jgi:IS30 family transposase
MTKPQPMDEQKKSVIWREWERGAPMASIARVIDKPPATVFSYLQYHGGIRPRHRVRRAQALSLEEREEISRGISHGHSIRFIANILLSQSLYGKSRGQQKWRTATILCDHC